LLGAGIDRVAGAVVPAVSRSLDADELLERIDLDALLERVDLNAVLDRVDVDRLVARIDVDALVQRVDVDALVARVDVDALVQRVDIDSLVRRAEIGDIISQSTGRVATSSLDLVRRQVVALDLIAERFVARLLRRDPSTVPGGPAALVTADDPRPDAARAQVSGRYSGPVSRLAAYAVDAVLMSVLFTTMLAAVTYAVDLVTDATLDADGSWWLVVIGSVWAFLYLWIGLAMAGRTVGMLLLGIKVVTRRGQPLSPRGAFVRVVTFPLSFLLLGLGFAGIVVGRERRALHDVAAGSAVVYDWGDRPAELPAPLTRWIAEHQPS
jgi:uncharacterized RDD family membrane protein YckC